MTDPYQILGVSKNATQEEIKRSYRKLAKNFHPDLNPGNKEAEKKFKAISHAFDQIGNAEARGKFDRGETDEQQQRQYEEHQKKQSKKGRSFYDTQQETGRYSNAFGEDFGDEEFFENLFGTSRKSRRKADMQGEDVSYQLEVSFKEAALGSEKTITLPGGKNILVKIPPGIESGKKLRFKGLGLPGTGKGKPGDAYIEIDVRPMSGFKRVGLNIEVEVPISFFEAVTGSEIKVPTIEGEVMLKIPSGVSTGSKLRIKGKGAGAGENRGHEIVILKVVIPKNIDPALKSAVEDLKTKFNYNPRTTE